LPETELKTIIIFIDTDKHASPFDILTAIDLFPDAEMLKYENVTVEDVEKIVYDALFPRGPEGAKHTKIFINGKDFKKTNEILEKAKNCMVPPFEISIMIDPKGAYTTATAAVAKTLELSLEKGLGTFENKVVTILAGTGPVGQTAARLYASEKAEVILTSRSLQKASSVVTRINEDCEMDRVRGIEAQTPRDIGEALEKADMVLSAGAAGTELLPLDVLKRCGKKVRIIADINAIPPLGVEGLSSNADGTEILPNVYGVGALTIGKLKNKIEAGLMKRAVEAPKGIFDFKVAYEIAKNTVASKEDKIAAQVEMPKFWLPS